MTTENKPWAPEPWGVKRIEYAPGAVYFEVHGSDGLLILQTPMRDVETEKDKLAMDAENVRLVLAAPGLRGKQ